LQSFSSILVTGALVGTLIVILSVSLAALIFSGQLSVYMAEGIALVINTAIITGLGITLFGRIRPAISMVDEDTAPVFALMTSFVVASVPALSSADELYATILMTIVVTTLVSGIGLALLGLFRFGKFIEFLPHSVMGGYFSAVGWLLVMGGLQVGTGADTVTWEGLKQLTDVDAIVRWLPALGVAGSLLVLRHRWPQKLLLPGTVLFAAFTWYGVIWLLGLSPAQALDQGFLLGPFGQDSVRLLNPLAGLEFSQVQWASVFTNFGSMASILLIAVLSMMLCISGLSLLTRTEPNMNHELKVAGLANITSAFGGGMTGLTSYSLSALVLEMGATRSRWVGILAIIVCTLIFLFGLEYVAYTPRFILSGILIYLGLSFLREWLIEGWQKFSPLEYMVIPIILGVSIISGFLQGIMVGLVAAIVLFVFKYSQTRVIAFVTSGAQLMSNVDRTAIAQQVIQKNGERLFAMSLQGYLFFGTAGQVYLRLQERLSRKNLPRLQYLLFDFSRVSGLDASAAMNFQKMLQQADSENFKLIVCGNDPSLSERLVKGGFGVSGSNQLVIHSDLDHALEWCEEQILKEFSESEIQQSCFEQLAEYLSAENIKRLMHYLVKLEVESGHVLTEQHDESNQLFFLESCAASAYIKNEKGESHRVRHTTRGTVFGELGFYLNIPRTATVISDEAGIIYTLDQDQLLEMEKQDPEIASGLHHYMANLLSERLLFTTQTLRATLM
jgi:SulP family sulfate permease